MDIGKLRNALQVVKDYCVHAKCGNCVVGLKSHGDELCKFRGLIPAGWEIDELVPLSIEEQLAAVTAELEKYKALIASDDLASCYLCVHKEKDANVKPCTYCFKSENFEPDFARIEDE